MAMADNSQWLMRQLKDIFGYEDFKSNDQEAATKEVFTGENDVYIGMQPGAGKSICFQLPAVLKQYTLTFVFVPTHSLGKNQVDFLKKRHIHAEYLCPSTWKYLHDAILKDVRSSEMELQFLYASTDKKTRDFVNVLITELNARNAVSFIVFDEAHCISRLSHDYIPNYREVAKSMKQLFPNIRKITLTATATLEVRRDIIHELGMIDPKKICTSSHSMTYQDIRFIDLLPKPIEDLKDFIVEIIGPFKKQYLKKPRECGIIFCRNKQAVKIIARSVDEMGIPVVSYHGDLSLKDRISVHERWIAGEIAVIATTPKFGIGLHGPNVRFVVHWNMPTSIQQLYQENGRFSEVERKNSCRIYFSIVDEDNIMTHIKSLKCSTVEDADIVSLKHKFFNELIDYCMETKCRHVTQLAYFGRKAPECRYYCDACRDSKALENRIFQFVSFRSITKQIMIHTLAHQRIQKAIDPVEEDRLARTIGASDPAPKARRQSYYRLVEELKKNYNANGGEVVKIIKLDDISEIARRLEFSLYLCASIRQKYNHSIVQAIRVIRKFNDSNMLCSYLKYYRTQEKWIFDEIPKNRDIIVHDENENDQSMEIDDNVNEKSIIEVVNLIDDSDSGSETN